MAAEEVCPEDPQPKDKRIWRNAHSRVTWDEQVIAEHDKERGTRQKIDEPDTPFIRSPQTASDSEGGNHSSDDEHHRLSFRQDVAGTLSTCQQEQKLLDVGVAVAMDGGSPTGADVDPLALASRLNDLVRMGETDRRRPSESSACSSDGVEYHADGENSAASSGSSSRASSSAPPQGRLHSDGGKRSQCRKISLPEDSPAPTSASFKAKRAQHYNEWAALKALEASNAASHGSTDESSGNTSEEEGRSMTKTNTNTNINQTIFKEVSRRRSGASSSSSMMLASPEPRGSEDYGNERLTPPQRNGDVWASSAPASAGAAASVVPSPDPPGSSRERAVSFSGESGGELSSEDFRSLRRQHYAKEWKQADQHLQSLASVETNTNTNLNAGLGYPPRSAGVRNRKQRDNPMEAGRPPVRIAVADPAAGASSSEEFRGRRRGHYDEVAAVRRFRMEADRKEEEGSEESDDQALRALSPSYEGCSPVMHEVAEVNPANPSEPRPRDNVAFLEPQSPPAFGDSRSPTSWSRNDSGRGRGGDAEWRAKRAAHYQDMAAAFRQLPPPSDEDDDPETLGINDQEG